MRAMTIAVFLASVATGVEAGAMSVDAPGRVTYMMPSGEIVQREMVLEVPAMGMGNVVLKGSKESFTADRFFSRKLHGRTVFYVVFSGFPASAENEIAVYRGTYRRGTNLAVYLGETYILQDKSMSDQAIHDQLSSLPGEGESADIKNIAAFHFEAPVVKPTFVHR